MLHKLKRQIPPSWRLRILKWFELGELSLLRLFAFNGFLASCYFTFFSKQFYREHKAVLQGRLAYQRNLRKLRYSSALLRRNIHRLEKGLIMNPRRPVFALEYLTETVDCYTKAVDVDEFCQEELQWATDVLDLYFRVVSDHPVICAAKNKFEQVVKPAVTEAIPYQHAMLPGLDVCYEQLSRLLEKRRSVRWFLPKPVSAEIIEQACRAASLAPSACNRQPYQFYVAHADDAVAIANCAMGTIGFADNFPCVIVVVGDLSAYPAERDRHVVYIDASLAAMQFMLALETLGLSSCPINWPDIEVRERRLSKLLGLDYYQRPVMLLAVGYADPSGGIAYSQKKSPKLLIKDIR